MSEKILLIDDMRTIPGVTRIARTFEDGLAALKDGGWNKLLLDHDLGDESNPEKTGYDIMCWLEANQCYLPGSIEIVSANPVGRKRMQVVIDKLYGDKYEV